jgi:hypothetical protein
MKRCTKTPELAGKKFGRLTVIERLESRKGRAYWLCVCDCGKNTEQATRHLTGGVKSCGCVHLESVTTHGMKKTRFWRLWSNMRQRCQKPYHISYKDYGGRGISVCNRWDKFENFRDDMYESYLKHCEEFGVNNTSIDRINNNNDYEPLNCVWATCLEQGSNKRNNVNFKAISPKGEEYIAKNINEFARNNNLHRAGITDCLAKRYNTHRGWSFERL